MAGMSAEDALQQAKSYIKKSLAGAGALKGEKGEPGIDGTDGFSPIITENSYNTDEVYKLDIETKDGKFTTPNLKGKSGSGSGSTTYIVNCEIISETDLPAEVVSYDGDFAKIQQTIADGGKVELRAIFNQALYNLELSRIEDDCVSFNTVDRYSNITIEINETGISDVKYISLRFEPGGEVEDSMFIVSGNIKPDDETVTFNQTFEEIKSAQFDGKVLQAEMLVESEGEVVGKYGFNLLYSTSEAIAFDWFSSAGKLGIQIILLEDDTANFVMTSLEGGSDAPSTLVITGNYSTDDDDNWTVSNIDKTFAEINEAITNNQNVVLKIYPEGDTTNPYILYPTMHYANMGTAFSLMVSDTGQISGLSVMITADNQVMATRNEYDFDKLNESAEIIHTDLSGNLAGITTVLDLVNALLEEYRTERKNVRFESGSYSNTDLTDLPQAYGYLTIKVGGTNILEVTFAYSNLGFKKMYYGFLDRTSTETLYSSLDWEEVNTGVKADIPIIENGKEVVQHKITKNRSITELEAYTDPNGSTGYKIDDLYLTYDCEKLAKGFDDWFAEKGITPVKGETYEDVAQIQVYSPSAGGYVYLSTHIKFDNITYFVYNIKYNDTDYAITSVQYDHTNGKTPNTFTGLNVFNIAKIIPELAGCYIQSDILDVLHNWFELYKPIGLEDAVGLYSKEEALLNQDLALNTSIDSKTVGPFDLGNIVSLMTSPLQKLLFSVDSEGKNLKAFANDEKNRTTLLTNGLFGSNLLAPKNTFATLNDMSTLPTPPDGALGIWTVVPDAPGQPESTNKGGTLIIAHITSMLYSQTINYIGTRIAIYVTQGAIYYALGYGGKYYPTASWTPASGGAFRWYKISSTLV